MKHFFKFFFMVVALSPVAWATQPFSDFCLSTASLIQPLLLVQSIQPTGVSLLNLVALSCVEHQRRPYDLSDIEAVIEVGGPLIVLYKDLPQDLVKLGSMGVFSAACLQALWHSAGGFSSVSTACHMPTASRIGFPACYSCQNIESPCCVMPREFSVSYQGVKPAQHGSIFFVHYSWLVNFFKMSFNAKICQIKLVDTSPLVGNAMLKLFLKVVFQSFVKNRDLADGCLISVYEDVIDQALHVNRHFMQLLMAFYDSFSAELASSDGRLLIINFPEVLCCQLFQEIYLLLQAQLEL